MRGFFIAPEQAPIAAPETPTIVSSSPSGNLEPLRLPNGFPTLARTLHEILQGLATGRLEFLGMRPLHAP
jgi:hypothetical protein